MSGKSFLPKEKKIEEVQAATILSPGKGVDIFSYLLNLNNVRALPYPLLLFILRAGESNRAQQLVAPLAGFSIHGQSIKRAYQAFPLLERAFEGHYEIASPKILDAIKVGWFDQVGRYFCDRPMPNNSTSPGGSLWTALFFEPNQF